MISFSKLQNISVRLNSNRFFEIFVVSVIIFSALVVGLKTYNISPGFLNIVEVLDWVITFIFLFEIIIRFIADPDKLRFFKKGWNIFDTLIVVVSLIPADSTDMAFLGRLIRIFRVLRMVSIIPELRILVNSLMKALPQLAYVMLLMFIIFYIYAAIGSTFFHNINLKLWSDISISMLTLFRVMTFEDWTDVMYEVMEIYPLSWIYFLSFIFFTAFAFLNMVIGIVVNVLEDERAKEKKLKEEKEQTVTLETLSQQLSQVQKQLSELKNKGNNGNS